MDAADLALGRCLLQRPPGNGDAKLPCRTGQTNEARQTDGTQNVTSNDVSVELDVREGYFPPHESNVERILGHVLDVLPDHILNDAYHRLFRHGGRWSTRPKRRKVYRLVWYLHVRAASRAAAERSLWIRTADAGGFKIRTRYYRHCAIIAAFFVYMYGEA